jgi:nucleotide-binding universal stress UspA family protein
MNTILLATDGSPSAEAATHEAIELAKATGAWLRVLTVWRAPILTGYGYAPVAYVPELAEVERERAGDVAREAAEKAVKGGVNATWELRQGEAIEEICTAAAETDARLIVLGAHGWGALQRLVFGSVSTGVLHHAPCPVLVVRSSHARAADRARETDGAAAAA